MSHFICLFKNIETNERRKAEKSVNKIDWILVFRFVSIFRLKMSFICHSHTEFLLFLPKPEMACRQLIRYPIERDQCSVYQSKKSQKIFVVVVFGDNHLEITHKDPYSRLSAMYRPTPPQFGGNCYSFEIENNIRCRCRLSSKTNTHLCCSYAFRCLWILRRR